MENTFNKGLLLVKENRNREAVDILLPLAKQSDSNSQSLLGFIYLTGFDGKRYIDDAINWLTIAAANGNGEAAHNLGTLYLTCHPEKPINKTLSSFWYEKAHELGFKVSKEINWHKN